MDDIFQYLVIIGAIIAAIVKAINKEKPKTATTSSKRPVVTTVFQNEKKIESIKQEPLIVSSAHQDVHSSSSSIKRRPTIQYEEINTLTNIEQTDHIPQITLDSTDEIRKAIIYSEIIQRKY